MPNWTFVHMTVSGPPDQVGEIEDLFDAGQPFNRLIPMPEELGRHAPDGFGSNASPPEVRSELERKYGYASSYQWRMDHWNSKWDADSAIARRTENGLDISFQSAFDFPYPVVEELCRRFPDCAIDVEASWEAAGQGKLSGRNDGGEFKFSILYSAADD